MPEAISNAELQRTVDVFQSSGGNYAESARILHLTRSAVQQRVAHAKRKGIIAQTPNPNDPAQLLAQIKRLQSDLRDAQQERVDHMMIKHKIIGLTHEVNDVTPPNWMKLRDVSHSKPGVPTLFLSDLHWAEVVDGKQINGVNEYNLEIAHARLRHLAERAVHLCEIISPKMEYPGIVVPLGGDMFSGNIHEELTATNQLNSMPAVLDLYGALVWFITYVLEYFPGVFLPCVTGNHGRNTKKIWGKDRHHTSFDWLLYCLLAKHFESDKRVSFLIPDGPDAYYKIYDHTYLLTHGDQFRGGDGVIGPLGPIIRGDHRKRTRNSQINMTYDTMLIGHWHQYIQLQRLIVNGSLKGYDEYAFGNNFPYEPPQQALWLTHPKYRITYRMPVLVDKFKEAKSKSWVSIAA